MAITARFGMEPIPYDVGFGGSFSQAEYIAATEQCVNAGAQNVSYSVAWNVFETSQGVYNTNVLSYMNSARGSAKFQITIAVLSYDGAKNLPTYLAGNALDAAAVKTAFRGVIDALYALVGPTGMDILALGSEVEAYLATHGSEITPFGSLIGDAKTYATAQSGWSAVKVTASFKYSVAASVPTTYLAILSNSTFPAFTYYPINGDLTVRYTDPSTIAASMFNDILALATAVSGTVILTEMGYPSSATLNSSPVLQGVFYQSAKPVVQSLADFDGVYSCQFQWLTDWPEWLLDLLGYTGSLRQFVGTLGLRDQQNIRKHSMNTLNLSLGGRQPGGVWTWENGRPSPPEYHQSEPGAVWSAANGQWRVPASRTASRPALA